MTLPTPPQAERRPHTTTIHNHTLTDDYFWLREKDNPAVIAYLEDENAYTEERLSHTAALQRSLYAELRGRIKEDDATTPYREGDYWYYSRTNAGDQYRIYCRKHGSLDAPEEVLLDQNALAVGHDYCAIGAFEVSPDARWLAYSVDLSGAEEYTLFVRDLTADALTDTIPNTSTDVAWASDNRTLFYQVVDQSMRPYKVNRHIVGMPASADVTVYEEKDSAYFMHLERTRSGQFLTIGLFSTTTSEAWYVDASTPEADWQVFYPRESGLEYSIQPQGARWLILTNADAKNFCLLEAPISAPVRDNWREVIPHRADVLLDGVDAFADYVVAYERAQGFRQISIHASDGSARAVAFPEEVYTYRPGPNAEYATDTLRFSYFSPLTPRSDIDYGMADGSWTLLRQAEIPSGFAADKFRTERSFATAPDGTQVPMSLVYPADIVRDGSNPTLLYGYGSYGLSSDPFFRSEWLSLMERGFVIAIAHIRGGSELGREWYEQGKLGNKMNTFTDFIACGEQLIAAGLTRPERLGIVGGSAGGLLMGAVINLRPDLFGAVVAKVPFVDVVNTMLDDTLPLTVPEYEQWGDPHDPAAFEYILTYSPYDNLSAQAYPPLLATAGLNDPRVTYWEPAKWIAKLRTLSTSTSPALLRVNMGAGHGGASGRFAILEEVAVDFAFLIDQLGASYVPRPELRPAA